MIENNLCENSKRTGEGRIKSSPLLDPETNSSTVKSDTDPTAAYMNQRKSKMSRLHACRLPPECGSTTFAGTSKLPPWRLKRQVVRKQMERLSFQHVTRKKTVPTAESRHTTNQRTPNKKGREVIFRIQSVLLTHFFLSSSPSWPPRLLSPL